jgi:hypothetical protein
MPQFVLISHNFIALSRVLIKCLPQMWCDAHYLFECLSRVVSSYLGPVFLHEVKVRMHSLLGLHHSNLIQGRWRPLDSTVLYWKVGYIDLMSGSRTWDIARRSYLALCWKLLYRCNLNLFKVKRQFLFSSKLFPLSNDYLGNKFGSPIEKVWPFQWDFFVSILTILLVVFSHDLYHRLSLLLNLSWIRERPLNLRVNMQLLLEVVF